MLRAFLILLLTFGVAPALAQEGYRLGDDVYLAGDNATVSGEAVDDVFVAGNTVVLSATVGGSAHAGGRSVSVLGPVGSNLYAAGMNVNVSGTVGGDAQLLGDTVLIGDDVAGDLRVGAQRVEINGNVGDSALVGAENILLTGVIAGDASFSVENLTFSEGARIDGKLFLYSEDPDGIDIPESVVAADRIERHHIDEFDASAAPEGGATLDRSGFGWLNWLGGKITAILTLTVLATLVAAIAPGFLMALRLRTLETPIRAFWMGFLTISALAGSLFLLALTGFGILLIPASIILAVALGLAGYVIGTYILGVGVFGVFNRPLPETLSERAVAALVGAVAITILALIPLIGWIATLVVAVTGAGALIIRWFAPGFYTEVR